MDENKPAAAPLASAPSQTTPPAQTAPATPPVASTTPPPTEDSPSGSTVVSPKSSGGIKSKLPIILVAVLLLVILVAGGVFFWKNMMGANEPAPTMEETPIVEEVTEAPLPTSSPSAGLTTYTNTVSMWEMDYPSDKKFKAEKHLATQVGPNGLDEAVVFSMLGPTQTDGTEFHDGISFTVGVKKKTAAQTVMQLADEDSKPDPETATRTPLKAITVNGLEGVETTVSGLGTFRFVYLEYPGKTDRVYYLAIFSEGPGASNAEYDAITEAMLQSFYSTSESE